MAAGKRLKWLIFLLFPLALQGQDTTGCRIRYISSDHVYITAGREQGLMISDTLTVIRNKQVIAIIRVSYAAARTASCSIIKLIEPVHIGDSVTWKVHAGPVPAEPAKPPLRQRRRVIPVEGSDASGQSGSSIRGHVALSYYQFRERRSGMDFMQPAVSVRLGNDRISHPGLSFSLRARSRMNRRNYRFSEAPEIEWRNRLYEFSLSNGEDNPFQIKAGRIISRKFSGVGYIDGVMLQQRVKNGLSAGVFGGIQPRWQFLETTETIQKYGAYIRYQSPPAAARQLQWTVAGTGAYSGSTISREYLYVQSSFAAGNAWRFYQSLELDINRNWRRARAGEAVSVTGVYISAFGRLNSSLSLNATVDNRRNYYTHAWISLADSLFDSAFRRGYRVSLQGKLNRFVRYSVSGGLRKTEGERRVTRSLTGYIMVRNYFWKGFMATTRYSRFENLYTRGNYLYFHLGHNMRTGHGFFVDYGRNDYTRLATGSGSSNHWLRLDVQLVPLRWLYIDLNGEHDWGGDLQGERVYADVGIRF